MSPGKKVWELIPHELEDKGEAVRHELRAMGWLALPVYVVVARWLWSKIPEDPRRRRRRAYTTGGLSPLSRA